MTTKKELETLALQVAKAWGRDAVRLGPSPSGRHFLYGLNHGH